MNASSRRARAAIATFAATAALTTLAGGTAPLAARPAPAPVRDGESNDRSADRSGLLAIEDAAEAVAEGEQTGAAAVRALQRVVAQWPGVRATLRQNGASPAALANVDATVAALRADTRPTASSARDANDVTGALAPLFSVVGDRVPAGVHDLDYLGRSVALDVRAADWARAARDGATLRIRWLAVRPRVEARPGGARAASAFDRTVPAVARAVAAHDRQATLAAARSTTDAVDTVEKVF